jgi:ABC-type transport system involved in multi-copper enzyme maturation permease subunit
VIAFAASVWWILRRGRLGLASLLMGIVAFELIQPVAVKSFGDLDRLTPFLSMLPNSFWALMNVTPDFLGSFGLPGYLSLGYTHPVYLILTETIVIWFGSRTLAGEMERGSIQFALSRPVSRANLYATRVAAIIIVTTVAAITGPLAMLAGVKIARPQGSLTYSHLFVVAAASWLLIWSIAGTTLLWSALSSSMSRSIGLALGVFVVSYVIDYFAALWKALRPLDPFSVFNYYDPASALARGTLELKNVTVLGCVGIVGTLAGLIVFVRRDLPV